MPGQCLFNILWLEKEIYKDWLLPDESNKHRGKCSLCQKPVNVGSMGESSLKSHMSGQKHQDLINAKKSSNSASIAKFFVSKSPSPATHQSTSSASHQSPSSASQSSSSSASDKTISSYMIKTEVQSAEIYWALKTIKSHYSYNSAENLSGLFTMMFPDSTIAKQFSCGPKKIAYICSFGLAPHFKKLLENNFNDADFLTVLFDETLNSIKQEKQMDIYLRYWNSNLNEINTRFYAAIFLGHSKATDLLDAFSKAIEKIDKKKILQISMDGPAVNWSFYDMLQKDIKKNYGCSPLNIGSCGLHVLNNAFKHGERESGWDVSSFLSSIYYLFKDCPARREDYMKFSKSNKFPLKFVSHRWLESAPCAERALEILEDIKHFIDNVNKGKILLKSLPRSYTCVQNACRDSLLCAKISFFVSLAKLLKPFLTLYQTDKPMLPFLAIDIKLLIKQCLCTYNLVKPEFTQKLSFTKICKLEFHKPEYLVSVNDISAGFSTDKILNNLKENKLASEKDILIFKNECKKFVFKFLDKMIIKCPVNYALVRQMVCLDPRKMATDVTKCTSKMQNILESLANAKKFNDDECETALSEYRTFLNNEVKSNKGDFNDFDVEKKRIDTFLGIFMNKYSNIWRVVKALLALSHGQATVERGFSINKKIETENLLARSYESQRIIYDHITFCGGIEKVLITKDLRDSVSSARQSYLSHLEKEKEKKVNLINSQKRKAVEDELNMYSKKMQKLEKEINESEKSAEELAAKGEILKSIDCFIKSNNLRKTIKSKKEELEEVKVCVETKRNELKNCF